MSTSQRAVVMFCGWGVKAGTMSCVADALENALVFKGALQMFRFLLFLL